MSDRFSSRHEPKQTSSDATDKNGNRVLETPDGKDIIL